MPSEAFQIERAQVAEKLTAAVSRYLKDAGIPPVNDRGGEVFGENAVGTHPSTRRMLFFLEDVNTFTPELIARIRSEVLAHHPRWTIVPQFQRQQFTVSAKTVKFGDRVARGEVTAYTPAFAEWLRETRRLEDAWFGAARRAFQYAVGRVPGLLPRLKKAPAVCVAALRGEDMAFVWVLMRPPGELDFRERKGCTEKHAVTADAVTGVAVVHPEFCKDFRPYTERDPAGWLKMLRRPLGKTGVIKVYGPDRKPAGTVTIDEYLSDDDLKIRLAKQP